MVFKDALEKYQNENTRHHHLPYTTMNKDTFK